MGFPDSSVGKESSCNAGDPSSIPGLGKSAGEGIVYPLQYSWISLVAQLVKNPPAVQETQLQSLAWEGPWRRERLPTPVFWPGEFHGLYSPWGLKESDRTERLSLSSKMKMPTGLPGDTCGWRCRALGGKAGMCVHPTQPRPVPQAGKLLQGFKASFPQPQMSFAPKEV